MASGVGLMLYFMTDRPKDKEGDNPKPTLPAAASSSSWLPVGLACFLVAVIAAGLLAYYNFKRFQEQKEKYWRVAGQLQDELLARRTDEPTLQSLEKLQSKIAVARASVGSHIETVLADGDPSGKKIRVETATGRSWFSLEMLCDAGDELLLARQYCPLLTEVLDDLHLYNRATKGLWFRTIKGDAQACFAGVLFYRDGATYDTVALQGQAFTPARMVKQIGLSMGDAARIKLELSPKLKRAAEARPNRSPARRAPAG